MASRSTSLLWQTGRVIATGCSIAFACLSYSWLTLPDVRALAKANPTTTAFMRLRVEEAARDGRASRAVQRWVPYGSVSPALKRAVLVTEDAAFWDHDGIDLSEIRSSMLTNLRQGRFTRGGSTITQQLAKNLYLSPSRNPYRKVVELLIARRLEAELSKARILELYLNIVEWGDGIWGAEAAARTYFHTSASSLSQEQAALLAAALINPRVYSPGLPNARLLSRRKMILARMGGVTPPPPPPTLDLPVSVEVPSIPGSPVSLDPK